MSKTLVIAGFGYIGQSVAKLACDQGFSVVGVKRTANTVVGIEGVSFKAADLSEARSFEGIAPSSYVVFCAAAKDHTEAGYRKTYVEGLQRTVEQLQRWPKPWPRVLFTSSTGVYGQDNGEMVTEVSPAQPESFSGRVMLEAESVLRASGLSHVILRLSGIYGPGRDRIIRQVREGGWAEEPVRDEYLNRIHRDDAARAIIHLLTQTDEVGVFIGSDKEPALRSAVLEYVSQMIEVRGGKAASLPRFSEEAPGNKRCLSMRLQESGFEFAFPSYREGLSSLVV